MDGEFDNMVIVFKVSKRKKAVVGSKVTNRYGGKGVISEIRKRKTCQEVLMLFLTLLA